MADLSLSYLQAGGSESCNSLVLCKSCLGENPYVQMVKSLNTLECKSCTQAFTVFKWRPRMDARFRRTAVCQTCGELQNICQVCLVDLEDGLPVQVRDTAHAFNSDDAFPESDVDTENFADKHVRRARADVVHVKMHANDTIIKLERVMPYYTGDRAYMCRFSRQGEELPCRRETPITGESSQPNIVDH